MSNFTTSRPLQNKELACCLSLVGSSKTIDVKKAHPFMITWCHPRNLIPLHWCFDATGLSVTPSHRRRDVHWTERLTFLHTYPPTSNEDTNKMTTMEVPIGARVQVTAGVGVVRWVGSNPPFAAGKWVGVEL